MKSKILKTLLWVLLGSVSWGTKAQNRPVYPVKKLTTEERLKLEAIPQWQPKTVSATLPASVDNSTLKYFPPVFNQRGNSCSQASGVRYVFTYEMNRLLDRAANTPENIFSYHFTWNFLNQGNDEGSFPSAGYDLIKSSGAALLADMPDESDAVSDKTWLNGYEKYLRALKYKVQGYYKISLKQQEGIQRLKQYLYNGGIENGTGGVATFSCQTADWKDGTYSGPSETGLTHYIKQPGTDGAHALTIVGYDDNVSFDLNGDQNISEEERGAFIVVNSWGTWWGDKGKCYYPYYFYTLPASEGGLAELDAEACIVQPETYEPLVVFKVTVNYTSRNDLRFQMGVCDGDKPNPSVTLISPLMLNQGGDVYMQGNSSEQGKELEFALDFTSKLPAFEAYTSPKFFLEVTQTAIGKKGEGYVKGFSVTDYRIGKTYISSQTKVPIQGAVTLSTGKTAANEFAASPITWLQPDSNLPQQQPFVLRTAEGKTVKIQFKGYDYKNGKLSIRYQSIP